MKKYLQNRSLTTYQCDYCGVDSKKPTSEYKRNLQKNRKNFCSRSCSAKANITNLGDKRVPPPKYSSADEYTYFRYYLRNAKKRSRDFNLTLDDLRNVWVNQNGICPYSGIKLQLSKYTKVINNPIYSASLDRIDNTKGYIPDNIQFVSIAINYMKNTMSHDDTLLLCQLIAQNHALLS
jgi:hypothetical protein